MIQYALYLLTRQRKTWPYILEAHFFQQSLRPWTIKINLASTALRFLKRKTIPQPGTTVMSCLLVNEVFWSLQGEGFFTGRPAVFIRLQGCYVGCPYCDTRYAQTIDSTLQYPQSAELFHKKQNTSLYFTIESNWLAEEIAKRSKHKTLAIITGGEPCRQDLTDLTQDLSKRGFYVQIETSGTEAIHCYESTWITLSPKAKPVLPVNWQKANEIKLPVRNTQDIARYEQELSKVPREKISLQPVSCDPQATALCVQVCQERNWRLSLQIHKYIGIL